jgi:hypothetical protein
MLGGAPGAIAMRSILVSAILAVTAFETGAAVAAEARFVRAPTIGCFDRGLMSRTRDMREDGHGYEARALVQAALARGECRTIAPGLLVLIEDGDILADLTKVRAQGEASAVWVRSGALSEN